VRIWDISTERCLYELRNIGPYERMNITGIRGIDKAQIAILHALGAIDGEK
jgi:hypothetical protein